MDVGEEEVDSGFNARGQPQSTAAPDLEAQKNESLMNLSALRPSTGAVSRTSRVA